MEVNMIVLGYGMVALLTFLVILMASLLTFFHVTDQEGVRKWIHIGFSDLF